MPSTYLDGTHLSLVFSMTHNRKIKNETYKELENSNEMGLLSFLLENPNIDINVDNIKKMYAILTNKQEGSFRKENTQIVTGENKFYVPTSKDNIKIEMLSLCDRYKYLNNPNKDNFDDIFKFILEFICIHPFSNGNGRLSSFIVEVFLRKFGLKNALYLPFDALMNGLYLTKTTLEIRKASGFFYKMKEYEFDSYIIYMKELVMKSYELLLDSIK